MLYRKIVSLLFISLLATLPLSAGNWLELGRKSIAQQNFDLAVEYFSNEIGENPKNALAYWERAQAYRLKGDMLKAAEDKQKAYKIDPDFVKRIYRIKNKRPSNLVLDQ